MLILQFSVERKFVFTKVKPEIINLKSEIDTSLPVMEDFYTLQGEGFHQGKAAYFIRLGGCDVGCVWCDVKESWDASAHPLKTISGIVDEAKNFSARLAVVTGGEPLMHELTELTNELHAAGFKTNIAQQLRISGAVFHNDYKDFQARVSGIDDDPITGLPSPKLSVLNAGKMRIRGAELEAAWTPIARLLIDGQLGYLDAEYKDFDDVRFVTTGGSRAFQTPAFAPKWTLRGGAQYAFDLGGAGGITLGGQTRYKSRTALAVDNTFLIAGNGTTEVPGLFQKGYWVYDARMVYETENKHFALGLYGQNLTKKAYKTDAQEFSSVGSIRTVYYGAPRAITLRLTARY